MDVIGNQTMAQTRDILLSTQADSLRATFTRIDPAGLGGGLSSHALLWGLEGDLTKRESRQAVHALEQTILAPLDLF